MTTASLDLSQRTGHFLDLLPTGALIIDRDLVIVEWNRTLVEWTEIPKEIAIGETLTELFPNLRDQRYLERLTQVFDSGFPATYSAAFHKHFLPAPARHGLECLMMIQQTEVRRLPESTDHALITIQDVSFQYLQLMQLKQERSELVRTQEEIAKINQELMARNQELDDFTRIASHDLKAPLRKITTFGEMFIENLATELDEDSGQYLEYMMDAAASMKVLIEDLMKLSRSTLGELELVDIDLDQVVSHVRSLLDVALAEKQVEFEIEELPVIRGDLRLITQLFQNLVGNAIKFSSDRDPHIRITAACQEDCWLISVEDNGIGIKEGHCQRIFEPFVRLHSQDDYEGTGFGLSICKKAVTKHGGTIWVDSAPGEGAKFRFNLPRKSEENADSQP
ncbi:MAG: ATP-binding protein [Planctomycetota bacterium]